MVIGLDEESDDFLTVLRYAMPDDGGGTAPARMRGEKTCPSSSCASETRGRPTDRSLTRGSRSRPGPAPRRPRPPWRPDLVALAKAICCRWPSPA